MKKLFLFFFVYCIFVSCHAETVRKCQCEELFECRKQMISKLDGCVSQCQTNTTSAALNDILQCIQTSNAKGSCIEQMSGYFCTSGPNATIDSNNVIEIPGTGTVRKILNQKVLNVVDQPNSNALKLLLSGLKSNERQVQKCLEECVQKTSVVLCLKEKSCSLEKPETLNAIAILPLCRQLSQQSNDEIICPCINNTKIPSVNGPCPA